MRHIFSLIVLGTIWVCGAGIASAAALYVSPATGGFEGANFTVSIYVDSEDQAMNAASGVVYFPSDKMRVVSLSKTGSIFNLWVQEPSYSNSEGVFRFEGVTLNPGFKGREGKILSVTFRPQGAGIAEVGFSSGAVLANDGEGTNILKDLRGARYIIALKAPPARIPTPVVQSPTHPDETRWWNGARAEFTWALPAGVDGVEYTFNANPTFIASGQRREPVGSATFDLAKYSEGVLYFHVRFHTAEGWGPAPRRVVRVDYSPPSAPRIEQALGEDNPMDPRPAFKFSATDAVSGIESYKAMVDGNWVDLIVSGGHHILPPQKPGEHTLTVYAYDFAGNASEASTASFTVRALSAPVITRYAERVESPAEALVVEGTASPQAVVRIYLRKDTEEIEFESTADEKGKWAAVYGERVPSGMWNLSAQTVDERGAVSEETAPVQVAVFTSQPVWGWVLRWGPLLLTLLCLVFGAVYAFRHLEVRKNVRRELTKIKSELKKDLKELEQDFEAKDKKLDLSPAALREKEAKLKRGFRRLEEDIRKEIENIDKLEDA